MYFIFKHLQHCSISGYRSGTVHGHTFLRYLTFPDWGPMQVIRGQDRLGVIKPKQAEHDCPKQFVLLTEQRLGMSSHGSMGPPSQS